jgi:hypothetical protein
VSAEYRIAPLAGPVPAWYSTLRNVADDEGAPKDVRVAAVEALTAYGALRRDRRELYTEMARRDLEARAELARRDATIAAAQDAIEREWDRGNIAVAPIAAALSAPVEAVNIVGGTHTDPGNTELDDAIEMIVGDYVADTLVRTDLAKRVLAEVVKRTGLGVYDKPLPGAPAEPGYQRIADAIETACTAADLRIDAYRPGGHGVIGDQFLTLARVLDKAGLIDWSAFAGAPAEPTSDTREAPDA